MKTDGELIEEINGGDDGAFEVLYTRYRDWVYNLARRFTGRDGEALDVLQETFMYLLKKFPGFVLTAKMTTFLYPVVKNFSITAGKKRRRFKFVSTEVAFSNEEAEAENPLDIQRAELRAAMDVLPENQREVVLLRFVDGFSLDEIAEIMKVPLSTVKSWLYKGLRKLRGNADVRKYFLG
ncbi:MAG: RNA polymerase sigma factor [Phycisphaerae bacterium]|nr:RNA polymerase sigma factor [Phycisphaerae bacterium]